MAKKCPKDFSKLFPHLFPQRTLSEVGIFSSCNVKENKKRDRKQLSSNDDSCLLENSWDAPRPKRKRKIKRVSPRKNMNETVSKKKCETTLSKTKVKQPLPKTKVKQASQKKTVKQTSQKKTVKQASQKRTVKQTLKKKTVKQASQKKTVTQAKPKKEPKFTVTKKIAQTSREKQPKSRALQLKASTILSDKTEPPSLTLTKNNANASVEVPGSNASIIDFSDLDSSLVKEEINEMLPNVNNYDIVEIKHDLTELIVGDETLIYSLPLECLLPVIESKSNDLDIDENNKYIEDPLFISEEEKTAIKKKESKISPEIDKEIKTSGVKRDSFKGSCDSINMLHDLTDIIAGDGKLYSSLEFQCSPQNPVCKSHDQNADENNSQEEDQLAVSEEEKSAIKIKESKISPEIDKESKTSGVKRDSFKGSCDSINMLHDLSDIIAGNGKLYSSLESQCSPQNPVCKSHDQNADENNSQEEDQLAVSEEGKSAIKIKESKISPEIDKESKTSGVKRDSFKGSCDSINMLHDLSDIIAGNGNLYSSLESQCSPQNPVCKSHDQNADENNSQEEDQLAVNEKEKTINSVKERRSNDIDEGSLSDTFELEYTCSPSKTESESNTQNGNENSKQEVILPINEKNTTSIEKRKTIDIAGKTESACAKRVSPKSLVKHNLSARNSKSINENNGYEKIYENKGCNNLIKKRKRSADIEEERKRKEVENDSSTNSSNSDSEGLSKELLKLLKNMHIKLQHEVPPQHKIENCAGSRPLTKKQLLEFNKYVTLKKGLYSEEEDSKIKANWINFCKLHNWHEIIVGPFLNMRHENKYYISPLEERKNFVRFLSNGLPSRSLYSVYNRFKNLYNPTSSGPFSSKEDEIILRTFQSPTNKSKKCVVSAKLLNRKKHSVWQRYQKLKCAHKIKSPEKQNVTSKQVLTDVHWSYPLVTILVNKLMKLMSCKDVSQLEYQPINDVIWEKMEQEMYINRKTLKEFWNLRFHMQLFCPKEVYLNDLKMDFIEYLYKNRTSLDTIKWDEVKVEFKGVTSSYLTMLFNHLMEISKKKLKKADAEISEIVEYLHKEYLPVLTDMTRDYKLTKVSYENGIVVHVPEKIKRVCRGLSSNPLEDEKLQV